MTEYVLVTGGAGYIGIHVVVELLNSNYNVIVLDNLANSDVSFIEQIKNTTNKDIIFYEADISDNLDFIFARHRIHTVIHLAGVKSVPESVKDPLKYYQINVAGSINLLQYMEKHKCQNIIYSSTACVYKPLDRPMKETDSLEPYNPYGSSKLIVENILLNSHFNYKILRYFNPIGCHSSGKILNNSLKNTTNLMTNILNHINGDLNHLTVYGNGTCIRDYIHIMDLAIAHVKIMNLKESITLNIGTGNGLTVNNIVYHFNQLLHKEIKVDYADLRDGDISYTCADVGLSRSKLNWRTQYTVEDMCKDTLLWAIDPLHTNFMCPK